MNLKRFISIVISTVLLFYLYSRIEITKLWNVFQNCAPVWMMISLGMLIPLTLVTAWRLQQLMPKGNKIGFLEANRLILGSSVLNMVLPSKMGDIAKAYFMCDRNNLSGTLSLVIVIFEKACDLLSLLLWCIFGLFFYPEKNALFWSITIIITGSFLVGVGLLAWCKFADLFFTLSSKIAPKKIQKKLQQMQNSWVEMQSFFLSDRKNLLLITLTSIFIWFLHLLQIWFFILALKAWTPFIISLALSPLSILAGLLPLTFAGVGIRDAALIWFYQPYFSEAVGAALGLLCTSRYFLPALVGLPFLGQMMATVRHYKKVDDY
jgi:glycosyltransferase 2 family protein